MNESTKQGKGLLGMVERVGNALPNPAIIFIILCLLVIVAAEIVARTGVSVTYFDALAGEDKTVTAVSLLNAEGLRYIFNSATRNFTSFAPLGTVLVAMLGVGAAEYSGLVGTSLKKLIKSVPASLLTAVVVFAGIMSNVASDAGYVVVIPLGAIVFASAGRHPIAGLASAFAGVSGGFSANLLIGSLDPLLQGITNEALAAAGSTYEVLVTDNWYFLIVSTLLLTAIGTFITERIVEPRLGAYDGDYVPDDDPITEQENKGLRNAGIALLIAIIVMGVMMFLPNAPLQEADAAGNVNLNTFLSNGLIFAIFLLFLIPGIVYGYTTGKFKSSEDVIASMTDAMKSMGAYLVLVFFAAQFVQYFAKTNLGIILSSAGAEFLRNAGFVGFPLILAFVLLSAFLNLFIGSASAKWAIMAPIFVPMLMDLGFAPEFTQVAYRVADSSTNIISPLMPYFAMIVVFAKRYDKKAGIGTLISTMLPYSMLFLLGWTLLLALFYFMGLPIGPGASTFM